MKFENKKLRFGLGCFGKVRMKGNATIVAKCYALLISVRFRMNASDAQYLYKCVQKFDIEPAKQNGKEIFVYLVCLADIVFKNKPISTSTPSTLECKRNFSFWSSWTHRKSQNSVDPLSSHTQQRNYTERYWILCGPGSWYKSIQVAVQMLIASVQSHIKPYILQYLDRHIGIRAKSLYLLGAPIARKSLQLLCRIWLTSDTGRISLSGWCLMPMLLLAFLLCLLCVCVCVFV